LCCELAAINWGIEIKRYEITEVMPDQHIIDAMDKQAAAERERRKKVLEAEGSKRQLELESEGRKIQKLMRLSRRLWHMRKLSMKLQEYLEAMELELPLSSIWRAR
jgi:regulator of protease activity HflC (stomatin/prohibitin superfamily)